LSGLPRRGEDGRDRDGQRWQGQQDLSHCACAPVRIRA
jgi:hypothetical protein